MSLSYPGKWRLQPRCTGPIRARVSSLWVTWNIRKSMVFHEDQMKRNYNVTTFRIKTKHVFKGFISHTQHKLEPIWKVALTMFFFLFGYWYVILKSSSSISNQVVKFVDWNCLKEFYDKPCTMLLNNSFKFLILQLLMRFWQMIKKVHSSLFILNILLAKPNIAKSIIYLFFIQSKNTTTSV